MLSYLYGRKWEALREDRGVANVTRVGRSVHDPIQDYDEDKLGRGEFARLLASALAFTPESNSIVSAVYGEYGSGKTSVINLCLKALKEQHDELVVVSFEPWPYSTTGDLYLRFFECLGSALEEDASLRGITTQMVRYGRLAQPIGAIIDLLGGSGAGSALGKLASVATARAENDRRKGDPDYLKSQIESRILRSGKRVVIVIDDLDRLSSEEIRDVFRLVKAVADFPNTRYLLAFDFDTATDALSKVQGTNGAKYLEKIVQVPFRLPEPAVGQLMNFVVDGVEKLALNTERIGDDEQETLRDDLDFLKYLGFDALWGNIRQVNRFLDALRLTLPGVAGEVRLRDFLALEALRVCQPAAYERLISNSDLLVGSTPGIGAAFLFGSSTGKAQEEAQAATKSAANSVSDAASPDSLQPVVGRLLAELFPRVQAADRGSSGFSGDFLDQWRSERRVCVPELFYTATAWALPAGVVSASEVGELLSIETPGELQTRLLAYDDDPRPGIDFVSALGRVGIHYRAGQEGRDPRTTLEAVFGIQQPGGKYAIIGQLGFDALKQLRREQGSEIVKDFILHCVDEQGATPGLVDTMRAIGEEHGWRGKNPWPEDDRVLSEDHLAVVCERVTEHIESEAHRSTLLDRDVFDHYLYLWEEASGSHNSQEYLAQTVNDSQKFVALLRSYLQRSDPAYHGSVLKESNGDRNPVLRVRLIKDFHLVARAREKAESLLRDTSESLDEQDRQLVEMFVEYAKLVQDSPKEMTAE